MYLYYTHHNLDKRETYIFVIFSLAGRLRVAEYPNNEESGHEPFIKIGKLSKKGRLPLSSLHAPGNGRCIAPCLRLRLY